MERKGLFHIYCGDGKGKTTAAVGLAVRAAGSGKKVLFVQMMKSGKSSELAVLENIPGITVMRGPEVKSFIWNMSQEQIAELREAADKFFETVVEQVSERETELLVIDECCSALSCNILDSVKVEHFVRNRPENLELVITGRDPAETFTELADYISEVRKIKHPFDKGKSARRGIEF